MFFRTVSMEVTSAKHESGLPMHSEMPVRHVCDIHVELKPAQVVSTPLGLRMTYVIKSGRVEGERLRGELLPGGGDWLRVGNDRVGHVDVRATIRTDDGALIHFESGGVIRVAADGLERLAGGQALSFEESYVRTTPRFETADERYAWLSAIVAVGQNVLAPGQVNYRIYEVL